MCCSWELPSFLSWLAQRCSWPITAQEPICWSEPTFQVLDDTAHMLLKPEQVTGCGLRCLQLCLAPPDCQDALVLNSCRK